MVIFFPGKLIEIEAEPEQVERLDSSSSGKESGKGFGAPGQGGAKSVLELKPRNCGYSLEARGGLQLQETPSAAAVRNVLMDGSL